MRAVTSEHRERRRAWRSRVRPVRILATLAVAGIWAWLALPSGLGGPLGLIWVHGTSMEPTLEAGDVAIVYRSSAYDVGDVVAFDAPEGAVVIHRIVDIEGDTYVPQGDNRDRPDHWRPTADDITGRMVLRLRAAGDLLTRLRSPAALGALTTALAFGLLLTRPRPESA
jgi:signal peptidase I